MEYNELLKEAKRRYPIGRTVSESIKQKHRDKMLGVKHSEITKLRMSLSSMNKNTREIIQYDLQDNFIKEWNSTNNAGRELKISCTGITNCLTNRSITSGGFKWKYK